MPRGEARVSNVCRCSRSNIAWVQLQMCSSGQLCGWVHCTHSVSLQWGSSYSCRQQIQSPSNWPEELQVKGEGSTAQYEQVYSIGFVTPHFDTVSSSACLYSGYLLSPQSCGIRILSAMEYGARSFLMQSILSAHFLSTITGVVVWSSTSSPLAVAIVFDRVTQASVIRILTS